MVDERCEDMTGPRWLRYSGDLLLGVCVGAGLTVVSFLVTAPLFSYAAYVVGPVIALVLYLAFIAPLMARSLRHRLTQSTIYRLGGIAIAPVGTLLILTLTTFD
ncbi:hypothetical protein [Nocardia nova]|uniref:Putative membrane protein n=1 Tax=Nocardia nova SH22a TaxID=1415166 RepID=W5TC77_9NOCA|nr:hypothetical protein [Nocardia nova]AHH16842.1 putative membrane protein [Nocardia nova SH22a]